MMTQPGVCPLCSQTLPAAPGATETIPPKPPPGELPPPGPCEQPIFIPAPPPAYPGQEMGMPFAPNLPMGHPQFYPPFNYSPQPRVTGKLDTINHPTTYLRQDNNPHTYFRYTGL